jgi:hypothetical protein
VIYQRFSLKKKGEVFLILATTTAAARRDTPTFSSSMKIFDIQADVFFLIHVTTNKGSHLLYIMKEKKRIDLSF